VQNSKRLIKSLEIAIDMMDRSEGTALYQIQKKVWGWSDKDYQKAIEDLGILLLSIRAKNENEED
tara:strand:+ start:4271 stop:4465 length:195 start_codon:yes stop_codon:yes gene_type:complete